MAKVVSSRFLRAFFLLLLAVSHVLTITNPRRLPLRSPAPPVHQARAAEAVYGRLPRAVRPRTKEVVSLAGGFGFVARS